MSIKNHILGFPRIGLKRELKFAQEKYWSGQCSLEKLLKVGRNIRKNNWKIQKENNLNFLTVGDFSWYDHVLTTSMMLGNIPKRHMSFNKKLTLDILFNVARGTKSTNETNGHASEMTKWFNTNYHYIVPEFYKDQNFSFSWKQILEEIDEAREFNLPIKVVLLSPVTYLWLGKVKGHRFNKLKLLPDLIKIYQKIFKEIQKKNITWIQIDEPILAFDLDESWKEAIYYTYKKFESFSKILLTTYFGSVLHNIKLISKLNIDGLHIDIVSEEPDLMILKKYIKPKCILSLGVINGRNIWRSDLFFWFNYIKKFLKFKKEIWISSSCSLLHVPIDLSLENNLKSSIKEWFSFAVQKCFEISLLTQAVNNKISSTQLIEWIKPLKKRKLSTLVHNSTTQLRIKKITQNLSITKRLNSYSIRQKIQQKLFNLPLLPLTTIGSFPQTEKIRKLRLDFKNQIITQNEYYTEIKKYIKYAISEQEKLDLDVLVHGEPERNDMVEYFSEYLEGFVFTEYGWVQSYGSRCVKPPIIIGDISRITPITIFWTKYAQSLTRKPVKGMLTGPVTILCWSFPREDLPYDIIAKQIACAIMDEVRELENSGINIIQIDEPALREGLPLRKSKHKQYLEWATEAFRLCTLNIKDSTQIHTHMCYCEFQDIMPSIVALDADVITIETSRSDIELLKFFKKFKYPNSIGPGVYDIHTPEIPKMQNIYKLLSQSLKNISHTKLWVNPDCGLKTRTWTETLLSLKNMVIAVKMLRKKIK
ncbi:5-methyltetrahydropteroyltriglutamate--homocysteine S-methyltransferase [Buchnera aphidicola]|uniref:5-methyltetrahydropteroyltriglutamate--homocysteine methyltransferase n=1 Tax=Buchnera aphidicola subsp. Tuberolachnus salignus TaxID=98804 RepID=A0A160SVP3_BUCTT|nr:5-methyltetrahydropteroyltriglutamate--homocysteine S-methyltransferase [Buchnera aphidicola]CUR53007.1 5-methyltetrahydropteroyltriglutamate--homocysteine methyltransferase [Buchnera aphidicola (Tuberolachnus salignus)]